jgi:hypothetical protein
MFYLHASSHEATFSTSAQSGKSIEIDAEGDTLEAATPTAIVATMTATSVTVTDRNDIVCANQSDENI